MKINDINIQQFAKDEYSAVAPTREELDGQSLVIHGENRSGKTLTFNAILYCVLGSQETIDLATGRGNRVKLAFDNDVTFARGQPHADLDENGDARTGEKAKTTFEAIIGDAELVKTHFLHSHIGRLPLSSLTNTQRLKQIRSVTNSERQQELVWHAAAVDQLNERLVESEDALRRIREEQPEVSDQISSVKRQLERHRKTKRLIEAGQLERIADQLIRDDELDEELDDLFAEKEAIRQKLDRLHKRKKRHEGYTEEVYDIISEAVNDFVCPACERRVTTKKAKNRIEGGYCPYCGQEGSIQEIKDHIRERVASADEVIEELTAEIEELDERKAELVSEIEAVKAQRPELSNLDASIKRLLKEYEHDIDRIAEHSEDEIAAAEDTLEQLQADKEAVDNEIEAYEQRVSRYAAALKEAEAAVEELEAISYDHEIQEFAEQWTSHYRDLAGDLGFEIGIGPEGKIFVPGGTEEPDTRQYDRLGDLSDAELRLLNISFAYTLNEAAVDRSATPWQVFVLDEPFANLDSSNTELLFDYLMASDRQFIITTSDDAVADKFGASHTISLARGPMQSDLGDFL